MSSGNPVRLAGKLQVVAATAWLFRDAGLPLPPSPAENSAVARRRRSAVLESGREDRITPQTGGWDSSAYHAFAFVNLVEATPSDDSGKGTTNSRLMLYRCLFWVAIAVLLAWSLRFAMRLYWNRACLMKKLAGKSEESLTPEAAWSLSRHVMAALDHGNVPEEWDVHRPPDILYFPRVEHTVGLLVAVPCTLACVAYFSDVAGGSQGASAGGVLCAIIAGGIVVSVLGVAATAAMAALRHEPFIAYVDDSSGGHWRSARMAHPDLASRITAPLAGLRGPHPQDFVLTDEILIAYAVLGPALACAAAAFCAYGGAASASNGRRAAGALMAGIALAIEFCIFVAVRPMRSASANAGGLIASGGVSVGFFVLAAHFYGDARDGSLAEAAVGLHLATVLALGLVELKLCVTDLMSRWHQRRAAEQRGKAEHLPTREESDAEDPKPHALGSSRSTSGSFHKRGLLFHSAESLAYLGREASVREAAPDPPSAQEAARGASSARPDTTDSTLLSQRSLKRGDCSLVAFLDDDEHRAASSSKVLARLQSADLMHE